MVLTDALDANRSFAGDLRSGSDDEMVLAVWASARDDYAPAYSLAIAYRCLPDSAGGEWQCRYSARMLRTGPTLQDGFEKSLLLYAQAQESRNASEMKRHLDDGALQWLEADVASCPNGIFAMDSIRVADWRPDTQSAADAERQREGQRDCQEVWPDDAAAIGPAIVDSSLTGR